jgi:hypothetical protein
MTPGRRGNMADGPRRTVEALRERLASESSRNRRGEAAAVAVLLGFEPVASQDRLAAHASRDGINWEAVLADETWSTGERFLIATAAGLWSGRRTMVDISRVTHLDDAFLQAWQDMITAALTATFPVTRPARGTAAPPESGSGAGAGAGPSMNPRRPGAPPRHPAGGPPPHHP